MSALLEDAFRAVHDADLCGAYGRVSNLIGLVIEATGLRAEIGELCTIEPGRQRPAVPAEVVGFREGRTLLMPLGELTGIGPGNSVIPTERPFRVPVGNALLGRVLDGLGEPIDGLGPLEVDERRSTAAAGPRPAPPRPDRPAPLARRPRARLPDPLRPRPAARHLRRLRRRQVVAPRHGRPLDTSQT